MVYQGHGWSKEMKKKQKSNEDSKVIRVIGKLSNKKTCVHGKKRIRRNFVQVDKYIKSH